jgi:hypothetical protein
LLREHGIKESLESYYSHPGTAAGTTTGPVKGQIKGLVAAHTTNKDMMGDDS